MSWLERIVYVALAGAIIIALARVTFAIERIATAQEREIAAYERGCQR